MKLTPPAGKPAGQRPCQPGRVLGPKAGVAHQVALEWLVDTGAEISAVHQSVGNQFTFTRVVGASASPTTGGGGILVYAGATVEFSARDATGASCVMHATNDIGVKSNNSGSNLLGMDQLASCGVAIDWDPRNGVGELRIV
jgi:hypothetical protein